MRVAVVEAPRRAAIRAEPVPTAGDGEVLIRVDGCGVCASSLPVWEGREWFEYPLAPGAPRHEGWGVEGESGRRGAFFSERAVSEYQAVAAGGGGPPSPQLVRAPFPGG